MRKNILFYFAIFVSLLSVSYGILEYGPISSSLRNVVASVFDTDIIPSKDNTWSLGLKQNARWQDARFSRAVGVGVDSSVAISDHLVLGPTGTTTGEGGQIKLLGSTPGKYIVLDNYNNDLRILIKSGGREDEKVRVTGASSVDGGRVLIGTSSTMAPGERLEVMGNIVSKGTEWTIRDVSMGNYWRSITYGNGIFVAVASSSVGSSCVSGGVRNCVMTSSNGINWATSSVPVTNVWNSVTYGNGLFVAVANTGSGNRVMTSPNGIDWTIRSTPADSNWRSITYGNGLFVAVAYSGTGTCVIGLDQCVMISPDGINWKLSATPANNSWKSVTYGNGLFMAVANSGVNRVMFSTSGIAWMQPVAPPVNDWQSVTYGNGLFVAVADSGSGNRVMTSSDNGVTWASPPSVYDNDWQSITYGNGLFVAVADEGSTPGATCISGVSQCVMTSTNGIAWTVRSTFANNNWSSIAYGNGIFVVVANKAVGNRVMTSGKQDYQITPHNNIYQGGLSILGSRTGILNIGTTTSDGALNIAGGALIAGGTSTIIRGDSQTGALFIDNNNQPIMGKFKGGGGIGYHRPILNINSADQIDIGSSTTSVIKGIRLYAGSFFPSNITFWTNGIERVRLDESGILSLGTTTSAGSIFIVSSTPRLMFSNNNVAVSSFNPAWSLRASSSGKFVFESTANYSIYTDRLLIDSTGYVGIGTSTPAQKLQVFGNVRVGTPSTGGCVQAFNGAPLAGSCASDLRLKKNLIPLSDSLDKLIELNPTYFNWRADEFPQFHFSGETRNLGLIAEDVEKIFPELVVIDNHGFKRVNYGVELMMHVIESIKELKNNGDDNETNITKLESINKSE